MKKPSRDPSTLPPGSAEAIGARLEEMERKIERLRSMYETFFSGVERQPPNAARRELNRLMLETQQVQIRNAALRFRFQSLSQRWTLMTTYWNRTLREIEAGTYRKDVAKVSRRLAQKGAPLSEQEAIALGIPSGRARALVARHAASQTRAAKAAEAPPALVRDGLPLPPDEPFGGAGLDDPTVVEPAPALAPPTPPSPRVAPVTPRPPTAPPPRIPVPGLLGMSEQELAALHRRYEEAARTTGRPGPSLARLKDQLASRGPSLMAQLGTQEVTFDVAVKDGRVVLRPKPRK